VAGPGAAGLTAAEPADAAGEPDRLTPPRAPRPSPRAGDGRVAWLFLAPYLVLFGAFVLAPIVLGLWMSLHSWDFTLPGKPFVGLDNYKDLFEPGSITYDPFWNSMQATGIFTLFSVPLLIVIPLAVALVMNASFRGRNIFRAIYFAPYVLGVAVVGVMWRFLLDRNIGAINSYAEQLGLPGDTAWLSSIPAAWVSLVGVTIWWTLGFNAVIYIAGLQEIPRDLYEAARVDGAGWWASFRHVTLPGLRPVHMFVTLITIIASANMFGQAFMMTNGAPARETQTAIFWIAETGLQNFQMGQAAAASWILTLALMLLSLIVFGLFRARGAVES
jgi:multiple sugar transport system permease protein